jgi:2-hydroxy-6-oxonona-2,4-dienedioate hydrolase
VKKPRTGRLVDGWVRIGGEEMHYLVSSDPVPADRSPVVLVHGQGVASRYLVPLAEHLAPDFKVYVPDLPGFGESYKPRHTLGIPELADALADWARAVGLSRAHYIGNSLGCNILAEFGIGHHELVDRLVLQGPTTDPQARTLVGQLTRWLLNGAREPSGMSRIMARDYARAGAGRIRETVRHLMRHPIEERLPEVRAPTLIVRGTRDPIISHAWAQEACRRLPNGALIELPGATHTINMFAPLEFTRVLRPFLADARDHRRQ